MKNSKKQIPVLRIIKQTPKIKQKTAGNTETKPTLVDPKPKK